MIVNKLTSWEVKIRFKRILLAKVSTNRKIKHKFTNQDLIKTRLEVEAGNLKSKHEDLENVRDRQIDGELDFILQNMEVLLHSLPMIDQLLQKEILKTLKINSVITNLLHRKYLRALIFGLNASIFTLMLIKYFSLRMN
jgi:hypothetical protein